eukprot:729615-Pelagomonas_calceolata.AAC.1
MQHLPHLSYIKQQLPSHGLLMLGLERAPGNVFQQQAHKEARLIWVCYPEHTAAQKGAKQTASSA